MLFLFRPCELEMDHKAYTRFLIKHHAELNLPYPFPMKLSFISSPLMFGQAMLVIEQDDYELVGAAGFVYGTGEDGYEDRRTVQVEVAYLLKPYRNGRLFARLLRVMLDAMKAAEPNVERVQFWASVREPAQARLFEKFLALPGSAVQTAENGLRLYQMNFGELDQLSRRLNIEF